ncbi:MAG: NAD-dependent deacylase [Shimia sp.]
MRVVVLTGAGISAESGLDTFRDAGGLWAQHRIEDVATPEAYARDPARVLAFYDMRRAQAATVTPNAAHRALVRLGEAVNLTLVTQNVDGLHEAAGARGVIHMHGQLDQALCATCDHRWPAPATLTTDTRCPACDAPAARPDIVWFGEVPYHMERIGAALDTADLFAAIGTSGQVYPAAGFADYAASRGVPCVELTLEGSGNPAFTQLRTGPATQTVPAWVEEIIAGIGA